MAKLNATIQCWPTVSAAAIREGHITDTSQPPQNDWNSAPSSNLALSPSFQHRTKQRESNIHPETIGQDASLVVGPPPVSCHRTWALPSLSMSSSPTSQTAFEPLLNSSVTSWLSCYSKLWINSPLFVFIIWVVFLYFHKRETRIRST